MTSKTLKTLLAACLALGISSAAYAEDVDNSASDSGYDKAYEECNSASQSQGDTNSDSWQAAFDKCMNDKGFSSESSDQQDQQPGDDNEGDYSGQ